jgi:hypothetical protein
MRWVKVLALSAATALAAMATVGTDSFRWSGKMTAGQVLEVRGVNGFIHAEGGSGDEIEVIARKSGHWSDTSGVRVEVVRHAGGILVCAVYPSGANDCNPESVARGMLGSDVRVDFTIRMPAGARFLGRTVNGAVEATSLSADAEAHTVNGEVNISTSGAARADTVNGAITASVGQAMGGLRLTTINGGITLRVPRDASGDVHAATKNGRILTDFPLRVRGGLSNRSIRGRLGSGGSEWTLTTVNGSISLRSIGHGV